MNIHTEKKIDIYIKTTQILPCTKVCEIMLRHSRSEDKLLILPRTQKH